MPVAFKSVEKLLEETHTPLAQLAIERIDRDLNDPVWLKNWICNERHNPTWRFSFSGTFSEADKKIIEGAYHQAGWGTVVVTNSADRGEAPGACGVTLMRD